MSDSESDFSENEQSQAEIKQKSKKTFKCNICEAVFTRKKNRNTHQLGHSAKNFACETCGKKFQYPSQLKKHMKTHVGYKCEEPGCDFIGENWNEKVKHRREKHRKKRKCEMPQKCPHCEKELSSAANLKIHVANLHGDFVETFQCGDCNKEYLSKSALAEHYKTVHRSRSFNCTYCGKNFGTKGSLMRHLRNPKILCGNPMVVNLDKDDGKLESDLKNLNTSDLEKQA